MNNYPYTKFHRFISIALIILTVLFVFNISSIFTYADDENLSVSEDNSATNSEESTTVQTGHLLKSSYNVRTGPGTNYGITPSNGTITAQDNFEVLEKVTGTDNKEWYKIKITDSEIGYIRSDLFTLNVVYSEETDFEAYLESQGFPESYKEKLRLLHAKYPSWVFVKKDMGVSWKTALTAECVNGKNTVQDNRYYSDSMKSMEKYDYIFKEDFTATSTSGFVEHGEGYFRVYDSGGYISASDECVAYYLDPRNFLDECYVFQFLMLTFDSSSQTKEGLQGLLDGTFMAGNLNADGSEEDGCITWADLIMKVASETNVNPYMIASKIIAEQGANGDGGCISGTEVGYEGYYNFFDWNAYSSNGKTAVENGLSYAISQGWDSRYKSILGGAKLYGGSYITSGQNTIYTQKYNIVDGNASHQYMTSVKGALNEAESLHDSYEDYLTWPLTFSIPVYTDMPEEAASKPSNTGDNNNYLETILVDTFTLDKTFDKYTSDYTLKVDSTVTEINLTCITKSSSASVTCSDITFTEEKVTYTNYERVKASAKVTLDSDSKVFVITVTSSSGVKRNYTLTVTREAGGQMGLSGYSTSYNMGNYVSGITVGTNLKTMISNFTVASGSVTITDKEGKALGDDSLIGTGMIVTIVDNSIGKTVSTRIKILGDPSGDGKLNSIDVLAMQKYVVGNYTLSDEYLAAADINGDGKVNSIDVLALQKNIVGTYDINQ